jgi:mono/diheme cytochrome c family protein
MTAGITRALGATLLMAVLTSVILSGQPGAFAAETKAAAEPDPAQFARGAQVWANTCSRCHNMRNARELRDDQWRAAMAHMRVRAGLTGQETRDVLLFLQQSN